MALRWGQSQPSTKLARRGRTVHVVHATLEGVTDTRPPPPPRTLHKSYTTIKEVNGSEEHDLLAARPSSSVSSTPSSARHTLTNSLTSSPTSQLPPMPLAALSGRVRELFLPPGFPASVTPDYLPYQLWSMPTHVTGHLSHSLVTSSLLTAVGVSASPAATVALSASIKWIVKDGVGALGRLIVGSRFSVEFDEDPRRWRLVAELLSTAGLGLEVATSLYPQNFLLLACAGKFGQALGKGMGKPVFRVIQTHFARAQNVGAVAAKEEVWEVVAQMAGLVASVAVLHTLDGTSGSANSVVGIWAATQGVHVVLRFLALRTLLFPTLSLKRAALLASASVRGQRLPTVPEGNALEPIFTDPWDVRPRVRLGTSAAEAFGGHLPPPGVLQAYAECFAGEGYVLVWREGAAHVMLKEDHSPRDLVRAVWQAHGWMREPLSMAAHQAGARALPLQRRLVMPLNRAAGARRGAESLEALAVGFGPFLEDCERAGWEVGVVQMKVGRSRLRLGLSGGEAA